MDTPTSPTPQKPSFFAVITVRHTSPKRPLGFVRDTKLGPFKTADDAELAALKFHPTKGEKQGASINRVSVTGKRDAFGLVVDTDRVEYMSEHEMFSRWQAKVYPHER